MEKSVGELILICGIPQKIPKSRGQNVHKKLQIPLLSTIDVWKMGFGGHQILLCGKWFQKRESIVSLQHGHFLLMLILAFCQTKPKSMTILNQLYFLKTYSTNHLCFLYKMQKQNTKQILSEHGTDFAAYWLKPTLHANNEREGFISKKFLDGHTEFFLHVLCWKETRAAPAVPSVLVQLMDFNIFVEKRLSISSMQWVFSLTHTSWIKMRTLVLWASLNSFKRVFKFSQQRTA